MPKFAYKIELDDTLTELFLSPLLNEKYQVPALSAGQEKLISSISEQFLLSEFILKSCSFNLSHKNLIEQIKYQSRMQLLKQMLFKNELNNIARNLNDKGIPHVFLKGGALNSDGIYPSGIRFSRDIDLLVQIDMLEEAYCVLKALGFRYLNPKTQDSVRFHRFGNHFPRMINQNSSKLELHWRMTQSSDFKNCPLTEDVFVKRRISNKNPQIFCPRIEVTIAHLIYHSFEQHRLNMGPIFLFDLAAIFVFFGKNWPVDHALFKKLGIEKDFEACRHFIERVKEESTFSRETKSTFNKIFKHSRWLQLSPESKTLSPLIKSTSFVISDKRNLLSKLIFQCRYTRTSYQVSYYSAKFWLILYSDILIFLKKLCRNIFIDLRN